MNVANSTEHIVNSAHAFAVACDSLYNAWLKVEYPCEFYETCLKIYSGEIGGKKDKEKMAALIKEMQFAFGIEMGEMKWGEDNSTFVAYNEENKISPSLMSVNFIKRNSLEKLYELSKNKHFDNFPELNSYLTEHRSELDVDKRMIKVLTAIGYFSDFGTRKKIFKFMDIIEENFTKKTYKKSESDSIINIVKKFAKSGHEESKKTYRDIDFDALYKYVWDMLPDDEYPFTEILKLENSMAGNIVSKIPKDIYCGVIIAKSYKSPWILFKSIRTGNEGWVKVRNAMADIPAKNAVVLLEDMESKMDKWGRTIIATIKAIE